MSGDMPGSPESGDSEGRAAVKAAAGEQEAADGGDAVEKNVEQQVQRQEEEEGDKPAAAEEPAIEGPHSIIKIGDKDAAFVLGRVGTRAGC